MQAQDIPQRKYALTKIQPGDYLLPSNDGLTIWRIRKYTDGPSFGLDWERDRTLWELRKWTGRAHPTHADLENWNEWMVVEDFFDRRAEAIDEAMRLGNG